MSLNQGNDEDRQQALTQLCQLYWYPLYAYARKRGFKKPDAEDLTQGFFQQLLTRDSLGKLGQRETSKLRSFLLTSFQHYITSDWRKATALKRGGDAAVLALAWDDAEARFEIEGKSADDPERFFDRRWAVQTLENAMSRLKHEYVLGNKEALHRVLRPALEASSGKLDYAEMAQALDLSEGAVRTQVSRFRKQFRALLRDEIAATMGPDDSVNSELAYLQELLIEA